MATQDPTPSSTDRYLSPRMERTARSLTAFCARERDRRENSGEPFDAALFDEAASLALSRLGTTEPRPRNDHHPSDRREPAQERTP